MKAAIRSFLKGVERVTDICSEILRYNTSKRGFSLRESRQNVRKWSNGLRRFTKKIKAANRKYMDDVVKLKNNLDSTILQGGVYDFFMDVTSSLVLYVKKLTKSIRPFLLNLNNGRDYLLDSNRAERWDLLKSIRIFKTSIMLVMENFFRIIDRTKELELTLCHNRLAAASASKVVQDRERSPTPPDSPPPMVRSPVFL